VEQRLERFFSEIINAFHDGLLVVDRDGVILLVNDAMARLSGFEKQELIGAPCTILDCDACELLRSDCEDAWCKLFKNRSVKNKRCMLTRKDGSYAALVKNATVIEDSRGEVFGAVETYTDTAELDKLEIRIQELTQLLEKDTGFHGIVGRSPAVQNLCQIIEKTAESDATILITGESGTGKELVARAVHEQGRRRQGPFVKINCAALNEALIESELFGHAKGAFTGAYRHRPGLFEAAGGGDIFLDEIGDIPLSTQAKLLRVLETRQFTRLGSNQSIEVDVRFITATNQDLSRMVSEGGFREDLFFRINVFPIHLPPLRERKEDIPSLVSTFIHELRGRSEKRISGLSPEAMEAFMQYDWPGNIRELKSALEYAFAVGVSGVIDTHHLPAHFASLADAAGDSQPATVESTAAAASLEKQALIDALRQSGGNQSRAAQILGVHRMTVFNRMRKHGISLKKI
jgi:PAS domain S-box-containing protein